MKPSRYGRCGLCRPGRRQFWATAFTRRANCCAGATCAREVHLGTGGDTRRSEPSGGHFNAGRKELRDAHHVAERDGLLTATAAGLNAAGEVPPVLSTSAERLAMWCDRLPSPAPDA